MVFSLLYIKFAYFNKFIKAVFKKNTDVENTMCSLV